MRKPVKNTIVIVSIAGMLCSNIVYATESDESLAQGSTSIQIQTSLDDVQDDSYESHDTPLDQDGIQAGGDTEGSLEQTDRSSEGSSLGTGTVPDESSTESTSPDNDMLSVNDNSEEELDSTLIIADEDPFTEELEEDELLMSAASLSEEMGLIYEAEDDTLLSAAAVDPTNVYVVPESKGDIYNPDTDTFKCYMAQNPSHGSEMIAVITGINIMPEDGKIIIPEKISYPDKNANPDESKDYRVMYIDNNAFKGEADITDVVFQTASEGSITGLSIGNSSFQDCTGIQKLVLPDNVFNLGNNAFRGCTSLKELQVPHILDGTEQIHTTLNNTGSGVEVKIGQNVFSGCTALTGVGESKIIFVDAITAVPKNLFYGCTSLNGLDLSGCNNMTSIQEWAFNGCTGLENLVLPPHLQTIEQYAFNNCVSLACNDTYPLLASLNELTSIGNYAFSSCGSEAFTKITFPRSLNTIGNGAFNACSHLENLVNIPCALVSSGAVSSSVGTNVFAGTAVTGEGASLITFEQGFSAIPANLFYGCGSLKRIVLPETVTEIQKQAFYQCSQLNDIQINNTTDFTSVGANAFDSCERLVKITLPASLSSIGSKAFSGCTSLSVVNPDTNTTDNGFSGYNNLQTIASNAFEYCIVLKHISFSARLTSVGNSAFLKCNSIESIFIPSELADGTAFGTNIFSGCSHLISIPANSFGEGMTSIPNNLFSGADGIRSVVFPQTVTSIGNNAFKGCIQLEGPIVLPSGLKSLGDSAFNNCKKIAAVTLNNNLESVGTNVFSNCDILRAFTFEEGITAIPANMFYGCGSVENIIIPDTVIEIGAYAFYNCSKLSKLAVPWSVEETKISGNAFTGCSQLSLTSTPTSNGIYGYAGSDIEKYANAKLLRFNDLSDWTEGRPYPVLELNSISLERGQVSLYPGRTYSLKVVYNPANTTSNHGIKWTSSDNSIATVDSTGVITAVSEGTANITATSEYNSDFTASCSVVVTSNLTSVRVLPTTLKNLIVGGQMKLMYSYEPSDAVNALVEWRSSNESVATVDVNGVITAKATGEAVITVASKVNANVKAECSVIVVEGSMIESISMGNEAFVIDNGKTGTLSISPSPASGIYEEYLWISDAPGILEVTNSGGVGSTGSIKGLKTGENNNYIETTIHAYTLDGSNLNTSRTVIVSPQITGVSLTDREGNSVSYNTINVNLGDTVALNAAALPETAYDRSVVWSSSNESVATVDENGNVTTQGKGSCRITAKSKHDNTRSTYCTVLVKVPVESISLNSDNLTITKGASSTLVAQVMPENADNKNVIWSTSNDKIATVNSSGRVTAVGKDGNINSCTITATSKENGLITADCTVTVEVPVTSVSLNKTSTTLDKGKTEKLTATIKPDDADDKTVTWASTNPKVASIDQDGVVTAVGEAGSTKTCWISATSNSDNITAYCKVTVRVPVVSIRLNANNLTLIKENSSTLNTTVLPDNADNKTVIWSSSNNKIATVNSSGRVTAVGKDGDNNSCIITAMSEENNSITATCTVTVKVPVSSVSLNKTSTTLDKGKTEKLIATIKPDDADDKTVTWASSNSMVASVDQNGVVTAVGEAGSTKTCWISVTSNSDNRTANCKVIVRVPVTSVTINHSSLSLVKGRSASVTASVLPSNADIKSVTWSSSNTSVATVSSSGSVRGMNAGTAIITVKTTDGGFEAKCTVTVSDPNASSGNTGQDSGFDTITTDDSGSANTGSSGELPVLVIIDGQPAGGGGFVSIPTKPSGFKAKAKKGKANLSWKAFKKKTKTQKKIWKQIRGIEIWYSTDASFGNHSEIKIGRNKKKYTLKGLSKGTKYYIKIRYYGNGYSGWSATRSVTAK